MRWILFLALFMDGPLLLEEFVAVWFAVMYVW